MKLLENFKELTIHPKNAEELKGLILQLAIQGKLTQKWREQNPDIEHASVLLEKVKVEKAQLLKEKKLTSRKPSIPQELENVELAIPEKWEAVRNFELFSLQKGRNPKDLSEIEKKYPYQDIEALDRRNIRRYSDDEKAPKCTDDDILVVCDGSRSGFLLDGKNGILGSTLAIIHTSNNLKDYIRLIFMQDYKRANANMVGAAIPHLDTKYLLGSLIGLPPLEEQKAIVSIVNQLFKEVDELEAKTKERVQLKEDFVQSALRRLTEAKAVNGEWAFLQEHFKSFFNTRESIKKLRESILQLAVQGKLTHHWRKERALSGAEVEAASILLEKIKAEKEQLIKDKKIKKEKPLPDITEDEIPYELPDGWVWCRLGEVAIHSLGKMLDKNKNKGELKPYLRNQNVQWFNFDLQDVKEMRFEKEEFQKYSVQRGDILICEGGYPGRASIWKDDTSIMFQKALHRVRFIKSCYQGELFVLYLWLLDVSGQIKKYFTGAGIQHLTGQSLHKLVVPLIPIEEQKAIVSKVNNLMALCDSLEQEIAQNTKQVEDLMKSCLKEVFEGA